MLPSWCFAEEVFADSEHLWPRGIRAGDGDAVSNLITFLLTGGWVSVKPQRASELG